MIFAVGWAVIPAIFKAFFNTNETLFTLMMNYIAAALVWAFELTFKNNSTGTIDELYRTEHYGWIPIIDKFNNSYIINIIIIVLVAVLVWVYLRFSKHGYELSVVGGSQNTARYVGINVKKVVIRTVILTGIICGVVGFLIVPGGAHTIAHESVGGRGFTAILICWISGFSIPAMGFYSFLINFVSTGCKDASKWLPYSDKLGNICVALFFVALLISTFFINFRVSIRWPKSIKKFFDKIKGLFKK
jgi:simple sugar transport system permease protein